ncbi:MAG: DUF4214 domain-containing protein [Clostridiales bacterium]|nr:DUF4214 domain-containing protein [Clostridiales bacterium]
MKLKRKLISCFLSVFMMLSFLPSVSLAAGEIDVSYVRDNSEEIGYGIFSVTYNSSKKEFWLSFIPRETGYYEILSLTGEDTVNPEATIFDFELNVLPGTVDMKQGQRNFDLVNNFIEGRTYYIRLSAVATEDSGNFIFHFFPSVRDTSSESFSGEGSSFTSLDCTATQSHRNHPDYYHYQWFDSNHRRIEGATASVYRPTIAGSDYYCQYSFYSCETVERKFHVSSDAVIAPTEDEPAEEEPGEPQQQPEEPAENNGSGSGSGSSWTVPDLPEVTETGVAGFVERLYTVALGRNSDPLGKQNWIDAITMRGSTGAEAARGFLYSDEFMNKVSSDQQFVYILYRTFFDREPDDAGFQAWVAALERGDSKRDVIEGFINSTEWANLCLRYGIASGGTGTPNIEVEPNEQTIEFATRLYTTCLNRAAEEGGLMAWARQLANQRDTGTGAARGFFFSNEFIEQNVSNSEFVNRLYLTFMGREADEAGFTAWVAQLDSGVSREEVFEGFAASTEFAQICASYGIIR